MEAQIPTSADQRPNGLPNMILTLTSAYPDRRKSVARPPETGRLLTGTGQLILRLLPWAFVAILIFCQDAQAQQQSLYSQYNQNNFLLNPALAGHHFGTELRLGGRQQFNSTVQNPATNYYLTANASLRQMEEPATNGMPIRGKLGDKLLAIRREAMKRDRGYRTHHGVGAMVVFDRFAALNTVTAQATYAFHYALNQNMQLSGGLGLGGTQYSINTNQLDLQDMTDDVLRNNQTVFVPTGSAGLWLAGKDFFVGASAQQLVPSQYNQTTSAVTLDKSQDQIHGYLTGGYKIALVQDFSLVPSVMLRYVRTASLNYDVNLTARYQDRYWLGASFRGGGLSAAFMAGMLLGDGFMVGYSYDQNLNSQIRQSFGTHEIVLGYQIRGERAKKFAPNDLWQ